MKIYTIAERKQMVKETDGTQAERKKNSPAGILSVKKRMFTAFALLAAWMLTGCSLATEAGNRISGGDRLAGIFVTTEYLGASVLETGDAGELETGDADELINGGADALINGTAAGRNGRKIYGTFDLEKSEYVFEGLEGYSLGTILVKNGDGDQQSDYISGVSSDCLTDVKLHMGEEGNTCSGILYYDQTQIGSGYIVYEDESYKDIYKDQDIVVHNMVREDGSEVYEVCADGKELTLYANPVYQTEDGQIYVVSENGGVMADAHGGDFTITISDTTSVTNQGKKNETRDTVEMIYRGTVPNRQLKFSWYNPDGKVLEESSFQADEVPDSIRWGEETAYILVTLEKADQTVDYRLIGAEDESYQVCLPSDSLILKSKTVEVKR